MVTHDFSPREVASILAGLRLVQHFNDSTRPDTEGILDILDNAGEVQALTNNEIDELCEEINSGD